MFYYYYSVRKIIILDWNYYRDDRSIHNCILDWFVDFPGPSHPFSIHNIISSGSYFGIKAGDWLAPSIISHILKFVLFCCFYFILFIKFTFFKSFGSETKTFWFDNVCG